MQAIECVVVLRVVGFSLGALAVVAIGLALVASRAGSGTRHKLDPVEPVLR